LKQNQYNSLLDKLGLNPDSYYKDPYTSITSQTRNSANGTIVYNMKQNGIDLYQVVFDNVREHEV